MWKCGEKSRNAKKWRVLKISDDFGDFDIYPDVENCQVLLNLVEDAARGTLTLFGM